jgi:hypothetical protein
MKGHGSAAGKKPHGYTSVHPISGADFTLVQRGEIIV